MDSKTDTNSLEELELYKRDVAEVSLMFGREASGFNHWRDSPRLVKVDSHCRFS